MRILYYTWDEIIKSDVLETFVKMGHEVKLFSYGLQSYIRDVGFLEKFEQELEAAGRSGRNYDFIFSCNFIPLISKIALRNKVPYACWIYDSPCLTMYSEMIYNPYNYMFHFDSSEVERIRKLGVSHIYHLPLAVNVDRVDNVIKQTTDVKREFINDGVAFMGNLYNHKVDFVEGIAGLPDYEKGYIKGIESAQLTMPGTDLIEELFNEDFYQRLMKYVSFSDEPEIFIKDIEMALDMIKTNISSMERINILSALSLKCNVSLYSGSECKGLPKVAKHGYIEYMHEMPVLFANSKVNLNITLRNIKSGIPLRVLDILGAGGFLLTNYCYDLSECMRDGEDYVTYIDSQDCCEKAVYYINHDAERQRIAANGNAKLRQMFSYDIQVSKMLGTLRKELS